MCGQIETLEQIKDIAVIGKLVFTVRDLDLNILEQSGDKGRTITCNTICGRAPLCVTKDKLIYSSRDGHSVLVNYNCRDKQFKQVAEIKDVHEKLINTVTGVTPGEKTYVYSGGWDNVVKQWIVTDDGYKPGCTCSLPTYINVLITDEEGKKIFAAGGDGNIWRLDYSE